MTTVYSADLNALFMADLGYTQTHFWLGDDISWSDVANWRLELGKLQSRYRDRDPVVYPGHGEPTKIAGIDDMIGYIDSYTEVVSTAATRQQAYDEMVRRYPDYGEADFFLFYSLQNHLRDKPEK